MSDTTTEPAGYFTVQVRFEGRKVFRFSEAKKIAQDLTVRLRETGLNLSILNAPAIGYECTHCGFYAESREEWNGENHAGLAVGECKPQPLIDYGQYQ